MRADGGAPGAGLGGIVVLAGGVFSFVGAGGFCCAGGLCCARTNAGAAKTKRPHANANLKWYSSRVPPKQQTGQLATSGRDQPEFDGLVRAREARAEKWRAEMRKKRQAPTKQLRAGSPRESAPRSATVW